MEFRKLYGDLTAQTNEWLRTKDAENFSNMRNKIVELISHIKTISSLWEMSLSSDTWPKDSDFGREIIKMCPEADALIERGGSLVDYSRIKMGMQIDLQTVVKMLMTQMHRPVDELNDLERNPK